MSYTWKCSRRLCRASTPWLDILSRAHSCNASLSSTVHRASRSPENSVRRTPLQKLNNPST
eukprot:54638-Prorocentrum_minimum.AAC.1